jgi:hypothetical protein
MYNEPSLDVREFLPLGNEFPPWGGGSDPESSSLEAVFFHEATILVWPDLREAQLGVTLFPHVFVRFCSLARRERRQHSTT